MESDFRSDDLRRPSNAPRYRSLHNAFALSTLDALCRELKCWSGRRNTRSREGLPPTSYSGTAFLAMNWSSLVAGGPM
jgi:hypothetical protein